MTQEFFFTKIARNGHKKLEIGYVKNTKGYLKHYFLKRTISKEQNDILLVDVQQMVQNIWEFQFTIVTLKKIQNDVKIWSMTSFLTTRCYGL